MLNTPHIESVGITPVISEKVEKGHVIAYGKKVSPPYNIAITKNSIIYINGIQVSPSLLSEYDYAEIANETKFVSGQNKPDSTITIEKEIYVAYKQALNHSDDKKAIETAIALASSKPSVRKAYVNSDGAFIVEYNDGKKIHIVFETMFDGVNGLDETGVLIDYKSSLIQITETLQSNGMIMFGFTGEYYVPLSDSTGIAEQISRIMSSDMEKNKKGTQLQKLVGSKDFALELLYNYEDE